MKYLKRIATLLLTGALVFTSACTFAPSTSSTGKDEGGQNAIVTTSTVTNVGDDNQGDTDVFALNPMKTEYHAYYNGKAYFRLYDLDDYYHTVFLYFSDPLYLNDTPGKHCLYSMDMDGNMELVTDEDPGSGKLLILNGVMYSSYSYDDGSDYYAAGVYGYDLNTGEYTYYNDYIDIYDTVGDYLVAREKPYYEGELYRVGSLDLFNPKTGEVLVQAEGQFLCTDDDSLYTFKNNPDYDNETIESFIYKYSLSGDEYLAAYLDNSYFTDWFLLSVEPTCVQVLDDYIFVNIGHYAGTGHFYNGGFIIAVHRDGSGFDYIDRVGRESFYVYKNKGYTINIYSDGGDGTNVIETIPFLTEEPKEVRGYVGQEYLKPYTYYSDAEATDYITFHKGDVSVYDNEYGTVIPLIYASDYEQFGLKMGLEEDVEYDEAAATELYDIEYVGDLVFFSLAIMERYPDDDIGWRYAYTHSYIADFVLNLKTKEVKLIHEAQ